MDTDQRNHRTNRKAGILSIVFLLGGLPSTTAFAQRVTGHDDGGEAIISYGSGLKLLRSFDFVFDTGEHHLRRLAVVTESPDEFRARVAFSDSNQDDDYSFAIEHQTMVGAIDDIIPDTFTVGTVADPCRGMCTVSLSRPSGDYVFVLRGFDFQYVNGNDNRVQHIGVYEENGNLTVAFHDGAANARADDFTAFIQYAWVPRARFLSVGSSEDWGAVAGSFQPKAQGWGVVRGFDVGLTTPDRNLQAFFLIVGYGQVSVDFHDTASRSPFNWPSAGAS